MNKIARKTTKEIEDNQAHCETVYATFRTRANYVAWCEATQELTKRQEYDARVTTLVA